METKSITGAVTFNFYATHASFSRSKKSFRQKSYVSFSVNRWTRQLKENKLERSSWVTNISAHCPWISTGINLPFCISISIGGVLSPFKLPRSVNPADYPARTAKHHRPKPGGRLSRTRPSQFGWEEQSVENSGELFMELLDIFHVVWLRDPKHERDFTKAASLVATTER